MGFGPLSLGGLWKEEKVHTGHLHTGEQAGWATHWVSQSWSPTWRRQIPLAAERTAGTGRRAGEPRPTHEECMGAGLPTNRAEGALHWQLLPHCVPQSERGKHPGPAYSTPQLGMRSGWAGSGEKTLSRDTGGLGAWDVVQVGQQQPVLALAQISTTGETQIYDGSTAASVPAATKLQPLAPA